MMDYAYHKNQKLAVVEILSKWINFSNSFGRTATVSLQGFLMWQLLTHAHFITGRLIMIICNALEIYNYF